MLTTAIVAMPLSVFAAEATACATWDEVVTAVTADTAASIKLTDHVTANSTIESFSGTFDGNGYTVTVEKTMFTALADGAVLKNFQTTAAAAISEAPIAVSATGTVTFTNVINNVSVSGTGIGQMGGFLTTTAGTTTVNMTSCVNNGNIQTNNQASGIIGNTEGTLTVNFTDVVNNGDITGNKNYAGGIVCSNGALNGTMNRVINNGDIYVESTVSGQKGSDAAGLIGTAKGKATVTLTECVNTGAVTLVTTNTSAHYGVAGFAIRTDDTASVFTFDKCVNTGVLTSATAPAIDAIAVPLKSGAAVATNCTYSSGTSTIAGATKVDAATAEASIAAIEAKMTLPTFDANKAPETTTPEVDDTPYEKTFTTDFHTVTISGPSTMTVGDTATFTITTTALGAPLASLGIWLEPADPSILDFSSNVVAETNPVLAADWEDYESGANAERAWNRVFVETSPEFLNSITLTFTVLATKAGTTTIDFIAGDEELRAFAMFSDGEAASIADSLGYSITVVEESNDESTTYEKTFTTDFHTVTISGPSTMTVGDTATFTITTTALGAPLASLGIWLEPADPSILDFSSNVVAETNPVLAADWEDYESGANAERAWNRVFVETSPEFLNSITLTFTVLATKAGTTTIDFIAGDEELRAFAMFSDGEAASIADSLGYSITVVEESSDTPDEPADNSTTLDATTGTLTVTGPATAVAGESFDVTFTWSDYGFTPDAIDLEFYLNTITSQTQAGNIAVSAIKSTNFTSYSEDVFGYADNTNLFKIGLTDMTGVGDTVEIVVTFSSTTPGYTGFSLHYAALSNVTGTGYTEIANYDKTPDYEEAYVIELTVPETSHTVIFMDGDTTLKTATGVAYGSLLADVYTAPAKEGYTFNGWKDASGASVTTVNGDITVYADYSVNEYTVNITVVNGSASNATQKLNYAGSIDATVNAALAAAGLAPDTGYTNSYTVSTPEVSGTTITVTVTYTTKLTYTVEFVGFEGADLGSATVEHGAAATAPTAPAVEGYTFNGWDKEFDNVTGDLTVNAVYTINKYTVTFVDMNGDTIDEVTVEYNKAATAPTAPAVEGYTFSEWDKDFSNVTGALTVTALYTINTHTVTVTVKAEGDYAKTTVDYGTVYTLPTEDEVSAKGLLTTDDIFSGWMINGESFDAGAEVTITADTVITAILGNVTYYTVTIVDGETTTTNSCAEGTTFTVPAAAGKTGYTFVSWTDDEGNVYVADLTLTVTADITLTAQYTVITFTVTFVDMNGDTIQEVTVEYGKAATAPTAPAVEGHTFSGWDTDFTNVTGDLTVTAVYTINKYTVTFVDMNGDTIDEVTVEYNKAATAPTAPAVEGYTFSEWDKDFSNVTGALTVTALYTINTHTVTVTVKAEGDYAKTTVDYGTVYTLPTEDEVSAKGLLTTDDIFSGWMINGESFDAGAEVTITADTVITAILGNVTYYTVTIVDGETTTTNSCAEGTTFTVPAAAGKTGYTFVSWTDDEGNVYVADLTLTVTADITLTAQYTVITFTVTFVDMNGDTIQEVTVEYGAAATAPTAPTVTGYTFSNWDKDFSNVTSDLTVTALYTINSYDIVITDHDGTTKTVKANYGENVLDVVNANYVKDASLVFLGFYNHNGTLISSTGKVTARTLVYVAYTVENILAGGNDNIVIGDGIITYYAGADVDAFTYGTVAKNGGTGDTITFTAPLLVADAVADLISFNAETATYTIIVMGDVDGDADVDTDDAALVADQMLDSTTLIGHFYTAANTTYPTALITARDIAAIKAFAKGTITAFAK